MVINGILSHKSAEEIAKLSKEEQKIFANKVIDDKLSYTEVSECFNKCSDKLTSNEIKELISYQIQLVF
jgi:uncharacterized protein YjgD (DUF1641 family)